MSITKTIQVPLASLSVPAGTACPNVLTKAFDGTVAVGAPVTTPTSGAVSGSLPVTLTVGYAGTFNVTSQGLDGAGNPIGPSRTDAIAFQDNVNILAVAPNV